MEKIIFRPAFLTSQGVFILVITIILDIVLGWIILPALDLYSLTQAQEILFLLIFLITTIIIFSIIMLLRVFSFRFKNSITIENDLMYYYRKPLFKSSQNLTIPLKNINLVRYRKVVIPIFTGKAAVLMINIWLVFNFKDGHKEEVFVSEWDSASLKNLIFYLKGRFPNIKFDTHVYRDSSEVLSGVNEILK